MKRIVMIGCWHWVWLTFARSSRRQGLECYLLEITDRRSRWRQHSSCLSGGGAMLPDQIGTPGGIARIQEYVTVLKACALVAVDDRILLWLARNRSAFEPACRLLMPSAEVIQWGMSKRNQIELARETGFDLLPCFYLTSSDLGRSIPDEHYPMVLRPEHAPAVSRSFKVEIVYSPAQLKESVNRWTPLIGPLVAQPLLCLPNLLIHGARTEKGKILALEAFLVPRKFEAISLTLRPAAIPRGLTERCRDFVREAAITGCFHFDLLISPCEKRTWFLEINTRLGGTTDKVYAIGFDEPAYLLQSYGICPETPIPRPTNRLTANRRALLKHAWWSITGRLAEIDYPVGSRSRQMIRSVRDLLRVKDSVFDWKDIRGLFWRGPSPIQVPQNAGDSVPS